MSEPTEPEVPAISYSNARIAALYAQGLVDYLLSRDYALPGARPDRRNDSATDQSAPSETSLAEWIKQLEAAAVDLDDPALPAKAGASLQPRHLGALGLVLMSCGTLSDAYVQLARYIRLLGQIGQPELSVEDGQARLLWHWPYASAPPQSVALFMLAARVRFMRWLSDRPQMPVDACFHGPAPAPVEAFEKIFGGRVQFDQPQSQLVFPAVDLELPVVMADASLRKQAEERAQSQLKRLTEEPPLVQNVKKVLAKHLASGRVALKNTAEDMHVSSRTLQRRLTELNANYQQLLDQVRADCAAGLIRDRRIPLAEVAFLLGYSDQSTFHTAYKRWYSTSPGQMRRSQ